MLVIGSAVLVQSLIPHGLVDEFPLLIDPVLVGGGKRLFADDGELRPLRLVDQRRPAQARSSRPTHLLSRVGRTLARHPRLLGVVAVTGLCPDRHQRSAHKR
jgi:RibD C-terminal domain